MTASNPTDQPLWEAILRRADAPARSEPQPHLDLEQLAMFSAGQLSDAERQAVIDHLADCRQCRQLASLLLTHADSDADTAPVPAFWVQANWRVSPVGWTFALAAVLVLGVSLLLWGPPFEGWFGPAAGLERRAVALLEQGRFGEVERLVAQAAREGHSSPRLINLQAQAIRGLPHPRALVAAGQLTDFGYGVDGVVSRQVRPLDQNQRLAEAQRLLGSVTPGDVEVDLNRGHLLLSQGQTDKALPLFHQLTRRAPAEPLAWLGLGLAAFLAEDLQLAQSSFRHAIQLSPHSAATHLNLAMTLAEEGNLPEAASLWDQILADPELSGQLSPQLREQIQRERDALLPPARDQGQLAPKHTGASTPSGATP